MRAHCAHSPALNELLDRVKNLITLHSPVLDSVYPARLRFKATASYTREFLLEPPHELSQILRETPFNQCGVNILQQGLLQGVGRGWDPDGAD
ncbi:hypothetical protein ACG7TL_006358 [Trametes sanguinea]